jgi:SAM-dependent methyltransferase
MAISRDTGEGADGSAVTNESIPESAACPVCDRDGAVRLFFSRDRIHHLPGSFGLFRCNHCQAIFIQPWLSNAALASYYPDEYGRYRHSASLNKKNYAGWRRFVLENYYHYPSRRGVDSSLIKKAAAFVLSFVTAKEVIPYHGAGRILDVGCGGGSYLYRLSQWGWEGYGVEPSKRGAEQAQNLGLRVFRGTLEEARFESCFFDVIRLSNVLEHVDQPKEILKEIHRILKPDGLVYITVPNTRSLVFWLFKENWYALDAPRHVISYCPRALRELCDATGFDIASTRFDAGPFNFVRSVKYFFEEKGRHWPSWLRSIPWDRSKLFRRAVKPLFFFVDSLGFGDFLHATLRKKKS